MDFVSRLDLYQVGRRYMLQRATKLEPTAVDTEGSNANLFVGATSFMANAVARQNVANYARHTLDGANGDDLDRLVLERTNGELPRKGAAPAVVGLLFSRASATAGSGTVPVGQIVSTDDGIEYVTTTPAIFGAATLAATCNAQAVQAGKATQVGATAIRNISKISSLWDTTLKVTNPTTAAHGEDIEEDGPYRVRARAWSANVRRGTKGAILLGALNTPGVASASAREALTSDALPARVVSLDISDSSGVSSAIIGANVAANLEDYRACGIAVLLALGVPQLVSIVIKLRFQAGTSTTQLTELIRAAIYEFVNSLGVNDTLSRADLMAVLTRYKSSGLIVLNDSVVEPTGDLVPNSGSSIRVRLQDISTQ